MSGAHRMERQGGAAMSCGRGPDGQTLLLLAAAVSLQLAQGRSEEDLDLMSAFFEVLGDNLALIAARLPSKSC